MKVNLARVKISVLKLESLFNRQEFFQLVTANAEIIVKANEDQKYMNILNNSEVSIDGQIPLFLFKLKNSTIDVDKISGSDLIYNVAKYSEKNFKKVFLLGGDKDSNQKSIEKLRALYPDLKIEGFSPDFQPYPFNDFTSRQIVEKLTLFSPDFVFVGFGAGKQEAWIFDNKELLKDIGVKFAVGSGGTFDFVAGKFKRAPKIIQRMGLESIYRLFSEPKFFRLKRILLSFKIFKYI